MAGTGIFGGNGDSAVAGAAPGVGYSADNSQAASQTLAHVSNAEWQDYLQRFVPVESALMKQTTWEDPNLFNTDVASAQQAVGEGMAASANSNKMLTQRYGMTDDQQYQDANNRLNNLTKSASVVNAANTIRQNLTDRNYQIATGAVNTQGMASALNPQQTASILAVNA